MRKNREAEILERTFQDRLSVMRKKRMQDPETQESVEVDVIVYEDIPCAYSQAGNDAPDWQEFHSEKKMNSVLFTPPGIFLQDNDVATVTTEGGQTFTGKTGRTFGYRSHGETPFQAEGLA